MVIYDLTSLEIKGDVSAKGLKEANTELDYLKLLAKDKRDYDASMINIWRKSGNSPGKS